MEPSAALSRSLHLAATCRGIVEFATWITPGKRGAGCRASVEPGRLADRAEGYPAIGRRRPLHLEGSCLGSDCCSEVEGLCLPTQSGCQCYHRPAWAIGLA